MTVTPTDTEPETETDSVAPELLAIEAPLREYLASLAIEVTIHRHPPLRTVEDSKALRGALPGLHIKNLFLRDKKRQRWLLTLHEDRAVDLKSLRPILAAKGGLSFASAELLQDSLGVSPGAVTPLALMNDRDQAVSFVIDQALCAGPVINAHPLHNQATVAIARDDLMRFLDACGHPPRVLNFDAV